jgi:ABC-type amino acid transport substrate-binding protein
MKGIRVSASSSVIQQAANNAGVQVKIQTVNSYDEALAIFESGQADALASDWETHLSTVEQNRDIYQSVGPRLTSNPFGIIVSLDDPVFRNEVDAALLSIIEDGTWQIIYNRWISEPPPWAIEDMLNAPPANR